MTKATPLAGAYELLDEVDALLPTLREIYEASLQEKVLRSGVRPKVKSILEHQRSALDYLAHQLVELVGTSGKRSQYPMAPDMTSLVKSIDGNLPGVRLSRPDVAAAIEARQPFQPGYAWLGHLTEQVNGLKHRDLTPQTRVESKWVEARTPGGGGVSWNPANVTFGAGVYINGQPVDPRTQMPRGGNVTVTTFVDWQFAGTSLSVLGTLEEVQREVRELLADVGQVVGW